LQTAITLVSPNPFNPATRVTFSLADAGPARIDIFTADGRFVRTLVNATHTAGTFDVRWDGRDDHGLPAATGTYWLRLQSGGRVDAQKALLLK
jgi:flagellar hook assembly protein FlgD